MLPSTHVLTAGPEFSPVASVLRVSVTPRSVTEVCALTVVTPVDAELRSIVQLPDAFVVHDVAEVLPLERLPGPLSIENVTSALTAFAKPVPSFVFTCAVNV